MQQLSATDRRARLRARTVSRPVSRTQLLILLAVACGAAYLSYVVYASLTDLDAEPAAAADFLPAFETTLTSTITTTGSVEAEQEAALRFDISGEVLSVEVSPGDVVGEGDTLAGLDTVELEQSLGSAESSLASAQACYQAALEPASVAEIASAEQSVLSAQTQLANAEQAMQDLLDKPDPSAVAAAEQALLNAENTLTNAKAAAEKADQETGLPDANLERSVEVAEIGVGQAKLKLAEARLGASESEIAAAQRSIDSAAAGLTFAEARQSELFEVVAADVLLPLQASVDQAFEAVERARRNLEAASIVAPFAGTVTEVNVASGDQVTTNLTGDQPSEPGFVPGGRERRSVGHRRVGRGANGDRYRGRPGGADVQRDRSFSWPNADGSARRCDLPCDPRSGFF